MKQANDKLYERKSGQKPFLPSTGYKGLSRPPKKLLNEVVVDEDLKREQFSKDEQFIDAETGEELSLTKARWSSKEGRLSLTAKTILNMGTGKLDLGRRLEDSYSDTLPEQSALSISTRPSIHPIVEQFLHEGPQTAMFHQKWNSLTDTVELDDDSYYGTSSTSSMRSLQKKQSMEMLATPTNDETRDMIAKYNAEYKPLVPSSISASHTAHWNAVYDKTFNDLFSMAEQLERNKSLTLEKRLSGGLSALRKTCQQLARLRVRYMQEIVQAIEDEEAKEKKRELNEIENYEKKELLKEIKKANREERRKGKLYIEALQRDQEIIFMAKLRDAGLLW